MEALRSVVLLSYSISQQGSLITVTFSDDLTDHDYRAVAAELREIVRASPNANELVDLSAVRVFSASPETIWAYAREPAIFGSESRQAIVAPTDVTYGMSRMVQMLMEARRHNLRVFRDRERAMAWLNRTGPDPDE